MVAIDPVAFSAIFTSLVAERKLSENDVRRSFEAILAGAWTPVQVGAFAISLRLMGETAEIIFAAAQAMRAAMTPVDHGLEVVSDTCGTGGDGAHTLNISSAAALVVAACGHPVAKHGNRSVSSRCGSADVFEALGIPMEIDARVQAELLSEVKIAFLFAPAHHPALKHAAVARRELGTRTIFNALGPLANPARATHQVVGVYDDSLRPIAARALGLLGAKRAWVVRSEDGLDEVSPSAKTRVSEWHAGAVREFEVTPEDFGVARMDAIALRGGDAAENAQRIERMARGEDDPAREAVILNAAASIAILTGASLKDAAKEARESLKSGAPFQVLDNWRKRVGSMKSR